MQRFQIFHYQAINQSEISAIAKAVIDRMLPRSKKPMVFIKNRKTVEQKSVRRATPTTANSSGSKLLLAK
ncbi:MAG: hypothetical protein AAFW67_02010, partial [Cyanobacteria bacterium J06638_38]